MELLCSTPSILQKPQCILILLPSKPYRRIITPRSLPLTLLCSISSVPSKTLHTQKALKSPLNSAPETLEKTQKNSKRNSEEESTINTLGPVAEYLTTECGFSTEEVSKLVSADSILNSRPIEGVYELVKIFRDFGFTDEEMRVVTLRYPTLLRCKADMVLRPKLEFLRALDLPNKIFKNVVSYSPRFLLNRLETVEGVLTLLQESGIHGTRLLRLLTSRPMILRTSKETLKAQIEYVRNTMRISETAKAFVYALVVVNHTSPQGLEKKTRFLESLGLEKRDIQDMARKDPLVLIVSVSKISAVMDFLVNVAGLPQKTVVTYPSLFKASIEFKLQPRYLFYCYLRKVVDEEECSPNLACLLSMTSSRFRGYFLEKYPDVTQMLLEKDGYVMQGSSFRRVGDLVSEKSGKS